MEIFTCGLLCCLVDWAILFDMLYIHDDPINDSLDTLRHSCQEFMIM